MPATAEQIVVALEPAIDLFGVPRGWGPNLIALYCAALDDLPLDLLAKAVAAAIRYGKFFPKPGELREFIGDDLARRQNARRRLKAALSFAEAQERTASRRVPA